MRFLTSLVVCILSISLFSQAWIQMPDKPGADLRAPASFVIGDNAYLIGGYTSTQVTLSESWRYHEPTDTWHPISPIPQAMRVGAGFSINGKGYVIGGLTGSSTIFDEMYEYDPLLDEWTLLGTFPGGERYGAFSFVIDDVAYVGGGNFGSAAGPYRSDMWAFEPGTNTWTQKSDVPSYPRFGTVGFEIDGLGYIIGGKSTANGLSDEVWSYSADLDSWSQKLNCPFSTMFPGILKTDASSVLVVGGPNDIYTAYDYYPSADAWYPIADYPGGSAYSSATFAVNDRYFLSCGYEGTQTSYYNDTWEYKNHNAVGIEEVAENVEPLIQTLYTPGDAFYLSSELQNQNSRMTIYDLAGKLLFEAQIRVNESIELPTYISSGIYIMNINNAQGQQYSAKFAVTD